ncbi:RabGAP/TBC [Xylariaceae sp. FL0016]|nr:RabGAP/TBC [Xylariaceae sp. FL0016]
MRSLADASARWQDTLKHSSSLAELQRAVKDNGPDSPCISGCRSICWKAFLLNRTTNTTNWSHALLESRSTYSSLRDHFLKYIKHPEYLTAGNSDPLADDADSPWNTVRHDENLRAEILQDVQRLPDEPFYHQPHVQTLILDVLFIYCKLNPDVGGYRQGMHELLAPIVYAVEQDAIDPAGAASDASADLRMIEMLDASFVEHDSFALFAKVMDCAKAFYEIGETGAATPFGQISSKSSIVEKSQYIHEVLLFKVDPELSVHLKNIEILPQVFLIRWIRLLFSREFPFDQMMVLWDTLFSVDPSFDLIDLVCTAMLVRIRWELLEADYTVVLQLLLRYPVPQAPHGPHTFIDDAVYLRDNLNTNGGSALVTKYTGRTPSLIPSDSRPATPSSSGLNLRKKMVGSRSPLSPSRFKPPQTGIEALVGAARNVMERGEKLGINQAVREALVEIRRNVSETRTSMKPTRDLFTEPGPNTAMRAVAVLDQRNRKLAAMLDESMAGLKSLAATDLDDKQKTQDTLEITAAKLQFVKIHLEDSTMELPEEDLASPSVLIPNSGAKKVETGPLNDAVAALALSTPMVLDSPNPDDANVPKPAASPDPSTEIPKPSDPNAMDISADPLGITPTTATSTPTPTPDPPPQRPHPPIPTRSTLAQSSFSWMLEHETTASSSAHNDFFSPRSSLDGSSSRNKRPSSHHHSNSGGNNASRERTAFLFGEVPADAGGKDIRPEDIFGLEPMKPFTKGKGKNRTRTKSVLDIAAGGGILEEEEERVGDRDGIENGEKGGGNGDGDPAYKPLF